MVSPACAGLLRCGVAVLTTVRSDTRGTGTSATSVPVVGGPVGGVPVAIAVLLTCPALISVWTSVCVPEQLSCPHGRRGVGCSGAQTRDGRSGSAIVTSVSVVFPVLDAV